MTVQSLKTIGQSNLDLERTQALKMGNFFSQVVPIDFIRCLNNTRPDNAGSMVLLYHTVKSRKSGINITARETIGMTSLLLHNHVYDLHTHTHTVHNWQRYI